MSFAPRRNYVPQALTQIEYAYVANADVKTDESMKRKQVIPVANSNFEGPLLPLDVLIKAPWPSEPTYLAALNAHPYDARIKFIQATHSYFVFYKHNDPIPNEFNLSASKWAKQQFPEFNDDVAIEKMVNGRNSKLSTYKYKGMTPKQIKDKWAADKEKASHQGTFFHLLFECHCNSSLDLARSKFAHLAPVQQYLAWRKSYFDPIFTEFRTEIRFHSSEDLRIVGTADLLAVRHDQPPPEHCNGVLKISIFDWKNTKELKMTNRWENGYFDSPCATMPNCNFSHYCIQQNIYAWLLRTFYNRWVWRRMEYTKVEVECMKLIIVHDNNPNAEAQMVDVPELPEVIAHMVDIRRKHLAEMISHRQFEFQ